jgi:DNA-binding phage protein
MKSSLRCKKRGNPTLETLQAILEALGLRVTVAKAKTA